MHYNLKQSDSGCPHVLAFELPAFPGARNIIIRFKLLEIREQIRVNDLKNLQMSILIIN